MRRWVVLFAIPLGLGCGSESDDGSGGSGHDAGTQDANVQDAASDGVQDVTVHDAEAEASSDGGVDALMDAPTDAEGDAMDAAQDASGPWAPYGLLSLNLHCLKLDGTSFSSHEDRFAAIAGAVHAESVKAITVQEACTNASLDALEALRLALESATGETWSSEYAYAHIAWEGTADEAEEGVGLLVQGTLSEVQTLEYRTQSGLRRVGLAGRLPVELGSMRLMSVHLDYMDAVAREAQARETATFALASADPNLDLLVAGDFNANPSSPTLTAMRDFGFLELTGSLGSGRIDHILTHTASSVAGSNARVVFDGTTYPLVSDHPGMLVTLSPSQGQPVAVTRLRAEGAQAESSLWVRGDTAPLSWTQGWPAHLDASGRWTLVLTEIANGTPFQYKFLRDDTDWQQGDDASGVGGQDHVITPTF